MPNYQFLASLDILCMSSAMPNNNESCITERNAYIFLMSSLFFTWLLCQYFLLNSFSR